MASRGDPSYARLIPASSSSLAYKSTASHHLGTGSNASISLREDAVFVGVPSDSEGSTPPKRENTPSPSGAYQEAIAEILGFESGAKVLTYASKSPESAHLSRNTVRRLNETALAVLPPASSESPRKVAVLMASHILQAPGLRNDFYLNLVAWVPSSGRVVVGLGSYAYSWGVDSTVDSVLYRDPDAIVCVKGSVGKYLVLTTAPGNLYLVRLADNRVVSKTPHGKCVFCVEWIDEGRLFMGDEAGNVAYYEVLDARLVKVHLFNCHRQQICGKHTETKASPFSAPTNPRPLLFVWPARRWRKR